MVCGSDERVQFIRSCDVVLKAVSGTRHEKLVSIHVAYSLLSYFSSKPIFVLLLFQ